MAVRLKRKKTRRRQLGAIERGVLEELSAGDLLYGFLLSARSSRRMYRLARERANDRYRRKKAIQRLIELEYIEERGKHLSITEGGTNVLGSAIEKNLALLTERAWDHKWRIAVFDIPEIYAPLRAKVRHILKRAGFVMLQQSVWVFPHECEELVQLIKSESQLSQYILYGVLDRIENEDRLKKLFSLK
ncbi:MAG TPA: CRISPR-associated endonuclease Cas2 [Candidatus Paceibacterota bacterium]